VEFPSYAVGGMTLCPHCQKSTRTKEGPSAASATAPQPVATPAPKIEPPAPVEAKSVGGGGFLVGAMIVCILAVGAWWLTQNRAPKVRLEEPKVVASKPTTEVSNTMPVTPSTPTPAPARPTAAKNVQDLKFSVVQIQRPKGTRGSKLIYATGSVTNSSNAQRLGVKVEIDLLNERGEKIDNSSDYRPALQPGEVWNFRALAHDPQVATGVVARIIEEN
jgi:hypothetical protein